MKAKVHGPVLSSTDLRGLPGARLRSLLLQIFPPEYAQSFDAQLADLLAEWAQKRESGRLRAAWSAAAIHVHLLAGAGALAVLLLAPRGLRSGLHLACGASVTLAVFALIANQIESGSRIPIHPLPPPLPLPPPVTRTLTPTPVPDWKKPQLPPSHAILDFPFPGPYTPPPRDPKPWELEPIHPFGPGASIPPGGGRPEVSLPPADTCMPLVRMEPDYPPRALARGVEGHVVVEMDIDASGSVRDPRVVASEPRGVFDAAVVQAVKRWRYRVASGPDAIACDRVQVLLRFEAPRTTP